MSSVSSTYILDEFPLLQERFLILDLIAGSPRLYLVSVPLKLLDFAFERVLQFFLLGGIGSLLNFVVDALKGLDSLSNLFIALIDLLLQFPLRHGSDRQFESRETRFPSTVLAVEVSWTVKRGACFRSGDDEYAETCINDVIQKVYVSVYHMRLVTQNHLQ